MTPGELQSASRCYCLSGSAFERAVLYLLNSIAGGIVPPSGDERITEEGDTRITEEGDTRIPET